MVEKQHISLPVIQSSINLFGGHLRQVEPGWCFQKERHQTFELLYVLLGHQTTEIDGTPMTYGANEMIIISPGTPHLNYNTSSKVAMTYFCFHFNIENLDVKSQIISTLSNRVIEAEDPLSRTTIQAVQEMLNTTQNQHLSSAEKEVHIEMAFLQFLIGLMNRIPHSSQNLNYSVREAKMARDMAELINRNINRKQSRSISVNYICNRLSISTSYGQRVFKKVYGVTPLHQIEAQQCRKAKMLLGIPDYSVEEVAFLTGFKNFPTFSRQFKKWLGMPPSQYRKMTVYANSANQKATEEFFM